MDLRTNPIGVFDSGVGGLTVVRELYRILPQENIIYFGDMARVPYGTKSAQTIKKFSLENTQFLVKFGIKLLVVACNSSSAVALPMLKKNFSVPVLGVIKPTIKKAIKIGKGRIGVIATAATIESQAYQRTIRRVSKRQNKSVKVFVQECPLFVPLAEEGWLENDISEQIAKRYLIPFKDKIDVLILGCTHYPLLKVIIKKAVGKKTILVDSAVETAKTAKNILEKKNLHRFCPNSLSCSRKGQIEFYVSDSPERFEKIGKMFLRKDIRAVKCIKLK